MGDGGLPGRRHCAEPARNRDRDRDRDHLTMMWGPKAVCDTTGPRWHLLGNRVHDRRCQCCDVSGTASCAPHTVVCSFGRSMQGGDSCFGTARLRGSTAREGKKPSSHCDMILADHTLCNTLLPANAIMLTNPPATNEACTVEAGGGAASHRKQAAHDNYKFTTAARPGAMSRVDRGVRVLHDARG